jgi:hypothetical protein
MMKLLIAALAVLFVSAPVSAQQSPCGPKAQIIAALTGEKYAEMHLLAGNAMNGHAASIYWNHDTGTLTVVVYPTPEVACILLAGKDFKSPPFEPRPVPEAPKPEERNS